MRSPDLQRLVVTFAVALFVAGPVAACICIDTPMADMSGCPDEATGGADHQMPGPLDTDSGCEFVPGKLVPASVPDLPALLPIASSYPARVTVRAPPSLWPASQATYHPSPPVYLVTLRIRD